MMRLKREDSNTIESDEKTQIRLTQNTVQKVPVIMWAIPPESIKLQREEFSSIDRSRR